MVIRKERIEGFATKQESMESLKLTLAVALYLSALRCNIIPQSQVQFPAENLCSNNGVVVIEKGILK
jgi:hypothetical protein